MATQQFVLWLEFELWKDESDLENDFFNMTVTLDDGRTYALNVWTFKFFERARDIDRITDCCLGGRYLVAPDLFVERFDRKLMEQIVADLIHTEGMKNEWLVPECSNTD